MRIFGGIIPFIGWRQITVDSEGSPCNCLVEEHWNANAIEVEWFGCGTVLFIGKVWADGER